MNILWRGTDNKCKKGFMREESNYGVYTAGSS